MTISQTLQPLRFTSPYRVSRFLHRQATVFAAALALSTLANAEVELIKIGNPVFEPSEIAFGSTTLEHPATGDELRRMIAEWRSAALGESHVLPLDQERQTLLPGDPHANPYEHEVSRAFAAQGLVHTDVVHWSEMTVPNRFEASISVVPSEDAPMGNSLDGESTPIIPNDVFPLTKVTSLLKNNGLLATRTEEINELSDEGVVVDENGVERDFSGLNWSHLILGAGVAGRSDSNASDLVGQWEHRTELLDASGNNGWEIITRWEAVNQRSRVEGDLNHNGELDMHDLNILTQNVVLGAVNLKLDLNRDEAVDVNDVHYWVTDLTETWIGDANLDGEFNSGDFVNVFTAGKYETDELALWNEGDWNADERFDSSDFVGAFQGGGYEMGIRQPVSTVPEPSSWLLAVFGIGAATRFRTRS